MAGLGYVNSHSYHQGQRPVYNSLSAPASTAVPTLLKTDFPNFTTYRSKFKMEDEYFNIPSVESCVSTATNSGRAKHPVIRLEKKKDGFEMKEGHEYMNSIPGHVRQDFFDSINTCTPSTTSHGVCKGEKIFRIVEVFLAQENPKVKDLRQNIPKAVLVCFFPEKAANGKEKVRDMWCKEPSDWRKGVPYEDPNNGQKMKKEEGLTKMFKFLQNYFKTNGAWIKEVFGLHMPAVPGKDKISAKLEAEKGRSMRDLRELSANPIVCCSSILLHKVKALEAHLQEENRSPRLQFKVASDIRALSFAVETESMAEDEVIAECDKITESFTTMFQSMSIQPESNDQGHIYLPQGSAHPSVNGGMDFQSGGLSPLTSPPPRTFTTLAPTAPVTFVQTQPSSNETDTLPSHLLAVEVANVDLFDLIANYENESKGMKRVASEADMFPEKKMKDGEPMLNGSMLVESYGSKHINDSYTPSSQPKGLADTGSNVDYQTVMKNMANDPYIADFVVKKITLDDLKMVEPFINLGSHITDPVNNKIAELKAPATNIQTGVYGIPVSVSQMIPACVEDMDTDDNYTLTSI